MKLQKAVVQHTLRIAVGVGVLSVGLHLVYWLLGKWTLAVLFGNLLAAVCSVLNALVMGIGMQKATLADASRAKHIIQFSYSMRMLLLIGGPLLLAAVLPGVDLIAAAITMLFARITIFALQIFLRAGKEQTTDGT